MQRAIPTLNFHTNSYLYQHYLTIYKNENSVIKILINPC